MAKVVPVLLVAFVSAMALLQAALTYQVIA